MIVLFVISVVAVTAVVAAVAATWFVRWEPSREQNAADIEPITSVGRWRLSSGICARLDMAVVIIGFAIIAVTTADTGATWFSNRVVLGHIGLERVWGTTMAVVWPWLMLSGLPLTKRMNRGAQRVGWPIPNSRERVIAVVLLAIALLVIVLNMHFGADKGGARILPGPVYEVRSPKGNYYNWVQVTRQAFDIERARLLREDGFFTWFGFFMVVSGWNLVGLGRKYRSRKNIRTSAGR